MSYFSKGRINSALSIFHAQRGFDRRGNIKPFIYFHQIAFGIVGSKHESVTS